MEVLDCDLTRYLNPLTGAVIQNGSPRKRCVFGCEELRSALTCCHRGPLLKWSLNGITYIDKSNQGIASFQKCRSGCLCGYCMYHTLRNIRVSTFRNNGLRIIGDESLWIQWSYDDRTYTSSEEVMKCCLGMEGLT
jgi:hypothetical protein